MGTLNLMAEYWPIVGGIVALIALAVTHSERKPAPVNRRPWWKEF